MVSGTAIYPSRQISDRVRFPGLRFLRLNRLECQWRCHWFWHTGVLPHFLVLLEGFHQVTIKTGRNVFDLFGVGFALEKLIIQILIMLFRLGAIFTSYVKMILKVGLITRAELLLNGRLMFFRGVKASGDFARVLFGDRFVQL